MHRISRTWSVPDAARTTAESMVRDLPFPNLALGRRPRLPLFQVLLQVVQTIQVTAFSVLLLNSFPILHTASVLFVRWPATGLLNEISESKYGHAGETTPNFQFMLEARTPYLISFLP